SRLAGFHFISSVERKAHEESPTSLARSRPLFRALQTNWLLLHLFSAGADLEPNKRKKATGHVLRELRHHEIEDLYCINPESRQSDGAVSRQQGTCEGVTNSSGK